MKTEFKWGLFFLIVLFILLSACDSSSLVSTESEERFETVRTQMKMTLVKYGSPFGPEHVESMSEGSVDVSPDFRPLQEPEKLSPSPFGCIGSKPSRSNRQKYMSYTYYFYFDDSVIEKSEGRYQHINWRALSDDAPNGSIAGIWRCIVPLTNTSELEISSIFKNMFENEFREMDIVTEIVSREYTPAK